MQKLKRRMRILLVMILALVGFSILGINSSPVSAYNDAQTTVVNNVIFFKFQDETEDFFDRVSLYEGTITEFYQQWWNGEENSVKEYFYDVSNGKKTFESSFPTLNGSELDYYTVPANRAFFMPYYCSNINGQYITNSQGYFEYELIKNTNRPSDNNALLSTFLGPDAVDFWLLDSRDHILNVYDCSKAKSNITHDHSASDGVVCKCEAEELQTENSTYSLIETYDKDTRLMYLVYCVYDGIKANLPNGQDVLLNDGKIDALTLIANKSTVFQNKWNDLLWPHSFDISYLSSFKSFLSYINFDLEERYVSLGVPASEARKLNSNVMGAINCSDAVKPAEYIMLESTEIENMSSKDEYDFYIKHVGTACHELSHLLGLPDYYRYSDNDGSSVGKWSLMCTSNKDFPQYHLSYDRLDLGFIGENNVTNITENGYYKLSPVTLQDSEKNVAFRVKGGASFPKQDIWIEYRNKTANKYDASLPESGLIVYRTDKSISSGNRNAAETGKYELYVCRNDEDTVSSCALSEVGESISNAITYQDGTGCGITVTIKSFKDNEIIFELKQNSFSSRAITLADLNNNQALFDKLTSQAIAQGDDKVYYDSFATNTYLDLSNLNLTDISFLDIFDISQVQTLNLASNSFTNADLISLNSKGFTFNSVCLIDNLINLETLGNLLLNDARYIYGIQNFESVGDVVVNDTRTLSNNWRLENSQYFEFKINGVTQTNSGNINISSIGSNTITFTGKSTNVYNGFNLSKTIINCTIEADSGIVYARRNIAQTVADSFILTVNGISGLTFETPETVNVSMVGNFSFDVTVKYNNQIIAVINQPYTVIDAVNLLTKEDFDDELLYNALYELNNGYFYTNSFVGLSYIDLSSNNISSISGLEKLFLKTDAVINFSGNNLSNLTKINDYLNSDYGRLAKLIILIDNQFSLSQNLNSKLVFGLQKVSLSKHYIDYGSTVATLDYNLVQDTSEHFDLLTNDATEKTYKTIYYNYTGKTSMLGKNINISIYYGKITLASPSANVEAKSTYKASDVIFEELDKNNYEIVVDDVDTSTISVKNVSYKIKFQNNVIATLTQRLNIVDTTPPSLTIQARMFMYLKKGSAYNDLGASAFDSYNGQCNVLTTFAYKSNSENQYQPRASVDTSKLGHYKISYSAQDLSNNSVSVSTTLQVGEIRMNAIPDLQINSDFTPTIVFDTFSSSMFTVQYNLNNSGFVDFDSSIKSQKLGANTLEFKFDSEEDIDYTFFYSFNVYDNVCPEIMLFGIERQFIHQGEQYVELGCKVSDNSTDFTITSNGENASTIDRLLNLTVTRFYLAGEIKTYVTSIPFDAERVYYIKYLASDGINQTTVIRTVTYLQPKVEKVELQGGDLNAFVGGEIEIDATVLLNKADLSKDSVAYRWYLDDKLVADQTTSSVVFNFTQLGTHSVKTEVINKSLNGQSIIISSNVLQIKVIEKSFIDKYGYYILIGLAGLIVVSIISLVIAKVRKSNFY